MANQEYIQIASDPVIKDQPRKESYEYTEKEMAEKELVDLMLETQQQYEKDRMGKEKEWTESYKMYMSFIDSTRNPFLSNLFIPKTHEAVELLSAFLIGSNQTITAHPEGDGDDIKASVAEKWLDWLWRKVLKARLKILTFIKQGIVFGNGVIKLGHDDDNVWISNTSIDDVYFDYYVPYIQDSEWIFHFIRKDKSKIIDDEKYDAVDEEGNLIRKDVIIGSDKPFSESQNKFSTYDKTLTSDECKDKVLLLEGWCKTDNKLITLAPTSLGWRVLRNVENPNYHIGKNGEKIPFRPFVKLRFKTSPLANRAYDTGAVYPTVKIQKSFNDLMNQYFDNVVLINNPMWKKRRGARINPAELVRRPGGVITMSDPNRDLVADVVGDVKSSIIEMLNRLDTEFQQASMVVNLLKGMGMADTATEAQLGQQNVQTLLEMIDDNINEALSELGGMILSISLNNAESRQKVKLFENENQVGVMEFDPKDISSIYDIEIKADRTAGGNRLLRQKHLLEFLGIVRQDNNIIAKYPNIMEKIYGKWLEEAGYHDMDYFFDKSGASNNQNDLASMVEKQGAGGQQAGAGGATDISKLLPGIRA